MSELFIARVCVALLLLSPLVGAFVGAFVGDSWITFEGAVVGACRGFLLMFFTIIVAMLFWFGVRFVFGVGA